MNTRIVKTLIKKEMLDVLRDKKTVIMMLVVPVILYPLIFIGAMQLVLAITSSMEEQNYRIAIEAEDDGAFLHKLTEQGNKWKDKGTVTGSDEAENTDETSYTITIVDAQSIDDYEVALENEELDVYIRGTMQDSKLKYDVYYIS